MQSFHAFQKILTDLFTKQMEKRSASLTFQSWMNKKKKRHNKRKSLDCFKERRHALAPTNFSPAHNAFHSVFISAPAMWKAE